METKAWDAAEFLDSEEAIAAYLNTYLEDGTPDELYRALNVVARAKGISALADKTGMSRAGIYKALGDGGNPSFATVMAILKALGVKLAVEREYA